MKENAQVLIEFYLQNVIYTCNNSKYEIFTYILQRRSFIWFFFLFFPCSVGERWWVAQNPDECTVSKKKNGNGLGSISK